MINGINFLKPRVKITFLVIWFIALIGVVFINDRAVAIDASWEGEYGTILKKATLNGLSRCYQVGGVASSTDISSFNNFGQLTNTYYSVALPNGLTNKQSSTITCANLFMGDGGFKGIFNLAKVEYGKSTTDPEMKAHILTKMGYENSGGDGPCIRYIYKSTIKPQEASTQNVCKAGSGLRVEDVGEYDCNRAPDNAICQVGGGSKIFNVDSANKNKLIVNVDGDEIPVVLNAGWSAFVKDLTSIVEERMSVWRWDDWRYSLQGQYEDGNSGDWQFVNKSSNANLNAVSAANIAIESIGGYSQYGDLKLTKSEKLQYYLGTIKNWFFEGVEQSVYYQCDIDPTAAGYRQIKFDPSNSSRSNKCGIVVKSAERVRGDDNGVYGITLDYFNVDPNSNKLTLEQVIDEINKLVDSMSDEELAEASAGLDGQDGESNGEGDPCYNAGIEGMSWIICPVLNNTSNTVDGIEEGYLRDWLQIKTVGEGGIFENGNGTHLYDGWSIFRNLANGLLIIVLLIIIFSQLTGYGIDNYGIKKMLPKLILMGILINLSFLFCQLAVDISNILGVGLDNMMKAIAANMNGGTAPNYTTSTIVTAVFGTIAGAGTAAGVAAGAIGGGGVMIAIVLLLALSVALVAVLMFFVMLSARIIIVAVFIVISPVAFVLYILPNTQNLFKKWWKIFETALVIYPICGALYGASYIIKAIVGGDSGGFIPGIIAVVAPFLPFLALPTLLRGAMAGLGALGGTLTMLGNGLKKGAASGESAIKNSNRFKDFQARREEGRATRTFDKLQGKLTKNGTLSARQRSRYVRAGSIVDRGRSEREKVYGRGFAEMSRDQVQGVLSDALKGNDVERANAAFNSLLDKGGIDEAFTVLGGANWATMDGRVSSQLLRSMGSSNIDIMKAFSKYRQSGGAAGFQNWANNSRSAKEIADDARVGAKVQSLAQHLAENGEHAMDGYGKDEAEFIANHITGIQSGMGAAFKKDFGAMMGSAGLNSKDAKAQAVWDKLITKELSKATPGSIDVDDLGMVADSFGIMREGMSHAVRQGVENYISSTSGTAATAAQVTAAIQGALADQISAAQASNIIKDRAKTGVLKDFGITP